jgi:hypothetical protein
MTSFELKRKRDFAGDLDNNRQMRIGIPLTTLENVIINKTKVLLPQA